MRRVNSLSEKMYSFKIKNVCVNIFNICFNFLARHVLQFIFIIFLLEKETKGLLNFFIPIYF